MDTKAMTAKRLAEIDRALVEGGEYVGTENEMTHTDGVTALNFAWELLSEVRRLRAVEEKAKVLQEAVRSVGFIAMLEAEAPKIVVGIDWARGAAPERCGGEPGKPNWQGSFRSGYHMGWHRPDRLCPAGTSSFICTPCPGCESCYDRRKIERRDRRKIERREPKGD